MQRVRRAPFMIAAAVILPLLIFLGIQFAFEAREQRRAVEAEALARRSGCSSRPTAPFNARSGCSTPWPRHGRSPAATCRWPMTGFS